MEKIYRIKITLESDDLMDLVGKLDEMSQTIQDGPFDDVREKDVNIVYQSDGVNGLLTIGKDYRCEHCHGEGEVRTDEDDGEGHTMQGVGTKKCICQK